jgi:hypothetical protein
MKFSDDQIQQLKDIFATKDDLKSFATKDDLKEFATKNYIKKSLAPIKLDIKSMKKDLDFVIGRYDLRLNHLEKHSIHPPGRADN